MAGQMFWGGLTQGLGQGLRDAEDRQLKKQMLKIHQRRLKLEEDEALFKTNQFKRQITDMDREEAAMQRLLGSMGGPPPQPQVETEPGDTPRGLTLGPEQLDPQTKQGLMLQATPRAGRAQVLREMMTGGKKGAGFSSVDDAIKFRQSPEFKELYPHGGRTNQGPGGFTFQGVHPVDAANEAYHRTLQDTGDPAQAEAVRRQMLFSGGAGRGAGFEAGTSGQRLGEPIQPMQPIQQPGIPTAPPSSPQQIPQIPQQPTPRGAIPGAPGSPGAAPVAPPATSGQSPYLRLQQDRAKSAATGKRQVEAQEKLKDIASTETIIGDIEALSNRVNTSAASDPVGRILGGARKVAGAWLQTDTDTADLTRLRDSFSLALARSILSERGVLTNQDRDYATKTIPGPWDSKELAQRSLFRLKSLTALQRAAEEALARGEPFDVEEFRRRWRAIASPTEQQSQQQPQRPGRLVPVQPQR